MWGWLEAVLKLSLEASGLDAKPAGYIAVVFGGIALIESGASISESDPHVRHSVTLTQGFGMIQRRPPQGR